MIRVLVAIAILIAMPANADGVGFVRVATADVTNSTTTPVDIAGLGWTVRSNSSGSFMCVISHSGTATSGPRFSVNGPATPTRVLIRWHRSTSATAQTQSQDTAFAAGAQTAAITASGSTLALTSYVYGTITLGTISTGLDFGTVQLRLTSSTAGQTVTVYRGSSCLQF